MLRVRRFAALRGFDCPPTPPVASVCRAAVCKVKVGSAVLARWTDVTSGCSSVCQAGVPTGRSAKPLVRREAAGGPAARVASEPRARSSAAGVFVVVRFCCSCCGVRRFAALRGFRLPAQPTRCVGLPGCGLKDQHRLRRARLREQLLVALPGWGCSGLGCGGLAPVWGCSLRRAPEVTRNLTGGQAADGLRGGGFSPRRLTPHQNPGEAAPAWRREQPRPQSDKRACARPRPPRGFPGCYSTRRRDEPDSRSRSCSR